jgi:hypothetical protein
MSQTAIDRKENRHYWLTYQARNNIVVARLPVLLLTVGQLWMRKDDSL